MFSILAHRPKLHGRRAGGSALAAVIFLLLVIAVAIYVYFHLRKQQQTGQVSASAAYIALACDEQAGVSSVDRRSAQTLVYHVTLKDAPVGQVLALAGTWTEPSGRVAHENHYRTQTIDQAAWRTHARFKLPLDAPLGAWTVKLACEGRVLMTTTFEVNDGGAAGKPSTPVENTAVEK